MKLLLAYIVMNYDVKAMAVRPASAFVAGVSQPPADATIAVRRRKA